MLSTHKLEVCLESPLMLRKWHHRIPIDSKGLTNGNYYPVSIRPSSSPFLALWSQKDGQVYEPKTMLGGES